MTVMQADNNYRSRRQLQTIAAQTATVTQADDSYTNGLQLDNKQVTHSRRQLHAVSEQVTQIENTSRLD